MFCGLEVGRNGFVKGERGILREEGGFTAAGVTEEEDADGGLLVCFHWGDAWFRATQ